jgi:hypothetical protein
VELREEWRGRAGARRGGGGDVARVHEVQGAGGGATSWHDGGHDRGRAGGIPGGEAWAELAGVPRDWVQPTCLRALGTAWSTMGREKSRGGGVGEKWRRERWLWFFYSGTGLGLGKPQQSSTSVPCLGVRGADHAAQKPRRGREASPSERRRRLGSGRSLGLEGACS